MLPALLGQEKSRRTGPKNHRVLTAASRRQSAAITHHPKVPPGTVTQFRELRGAIQVAIGPHDRLATGNSHLRLAPWSPRSVRRPSRHAEVDDLLVFLPQMRKDFPKTRYRRCA
jgi:hypothetical protein